MITVIFDHNYGHYGPLTVSVLEQLLERIKRDAYPRDARVAIQQTSDQGGGDYLHVRVTYEHETQRSGG